MGFFIHDFCCCCDVCFDASVVLNGGIFLCQSQCLQKVIAPVEGGEEGEKDDFTTLVVLPYCSRGISQPAIENIDIANF